MTLEPGMLLATPRETDDPGLWFIIYVDDEGVVAFDLTREHSDIGYKTFEYALNFADNKSELEKIVLAGGPERPNEGLIIVHETRGSTEDSRPINADFAFMSYNYVPLPGRPPVLITPDNKPSELKLKEPCGFVIAMGFRVFDTPALVKEIAEGSWICLHATSDLIFHTSRHDRRAKLVNLMN